MVRDFVGIVDVVRPVFNGDDTPHGKHLGGDVDALGFAAAGITAQVDDGRLGVLGSLQCLHEFSVGSFVARSIRVCEFVNADDGDGVNYLVCNRRGEVRSDFEGVVDFDSVAGLVAPDGYGHSVADGSFGQV